MFHQNKIADLFSLLSRIAFSFVLVFIPFRLRMIPVLRPRLGVYGDYTDFLFYAMDAACLGMMVFWLLSLQLNPRRLTLGPAAFTLPLTGFLASGLLSLLNSFDTSLTAYHLLRLAALVILYVFMINEIHAASWFVVPLGLGVLLQSLVAIGQSLAQQDLGLRWLGEYPLDPNAQFMSILEVDGVRFLRAYGLSDHPNILGGFLAFGLLVLFALVAAKNVRTWQRFLAAFVFLCGSAALFATFSRSAWVALAVGILFILGGEWLQRNRRGLVYACLLLLASAAVIFSLAQNSREYAAARFDVNDSFSNNRVERGAVVERLYLYVQAQQIMEKHPWTGVGLGASVIAMQVYYPVFKMSYQPPHVSMLAAAMEMGFPGAVFYAGMMVMPFYMAFRNPQILRDAGAVASLALILVVAVIGLFDHYPWMLVPGRTMQWLAWGAFAARWQTQKR